MKAQTALRLVGTAAIVSIVTECAAEDPSTLFKRTCSACHGLDGKADTKMARRLGVKDLTRTKLTDPEIEQTIRNGFKDATGQSRMPAFGESLKDEEIKALIQAVNTLRK
jgi:mono/diheme cytochrome c family protein